MKLKIQEMYIEYRITKVGRLERQTDRVISSYYKSIFIFTKGFDKNKHHLQVMINLN